METVTYSLTDGAASLPRQPKFLTLIDALRGFFGIRNGGAVQRLRTATHSIGKERHALKELSRMSDYELADIGLSRSDLTFEGLAVAGVKRALKQDAVAREIASTRAIREATGRGNQY